MQKIMFNDTYGLTQAVLNGTKTMTRRLIPPKVVEYALNVYRQDYYSAALDYLNDKECLEGWLIVEKKSRYKLGEVVAVAQSYKSIHNEMTNGDYGDSKYDAFRYAVVAGTKGWTNKMFVRADLMPYRIKITDIKAEKLQDISDEDCLKEGVYYDADVDGYKVFNLSLPNKGWGRLFRQMYFKTPREAFAALINRHGVGRKGLWESNPFVVVYEFKLIK